MDAVVRRSATAMTRQLVGAVVGAGVSPGVPAQRLSQQAQGIIAASVLRLGAGMLCATMLLRPEISGPWGPWVAGWLVVSSLAVVAASWAGLGSRVPLRFAALRRVVEPGIAGVDTLAFITVALGSDPSFGYRTVGVLGLVLLAQAPTRWGVRGVVLVVLPVTVVALARPAGLAEGVGGRVALVTVIAGATLLGLWMKRLLGRQASLADHARATLAVVFDRSPTPATITCTSGRLLQVNAALSRLCGYDADHLVGRRLVELFDTGDAERLERLLASVADEVAEPVTTGSPGLTMEARLRNLGGSRWVRLSVASVPASGGLPAQLVVQAEDVEERRAHAERLEHEATHDALTGLPNRRAVHRDLARLTDDDGDVGARGALVLVDLDGFKAVNDELGHEAGDDLLIVAADRLRSVLRPRESAGRLAGDELVVLADDVPSAEEARALGTRVLAGLVGPARLRAGTVELRASAGVRRLGRGDPASILRDADAALYRAKRSGGCRVELAEARSPHAGVALSARDR